MALKKNVAKKISKKAARKVTQSKTKRAKDAPATAKAVKTARKAAATDDATPRPKRKYKPSMSIDFQPGSDMYIAFQEVQKGGESRQAVGHRLQEMWTDHKTRNNKPKPVSTIMNHVVRRAKANGYVVKQTWQLVKADGTPTVAASAVDIPVEGTPKPKKAVKKSGKRRTKAEALAGTKAVTKKTSRKAVKRRAGA